MMGSQNYQCSECKRDFAVRFFWTKPDPEELNCPNCGSKKVIEAAAGCGCSSQPKDSKGSRFT
jgi:DNA-directed RNA polymerase subunit RPC12/RpoP